MHWLEPKPVAAEWEERGAETRKTGSEVLLPEASVFSSLKMGVAALAMVLTLRQQQLAVKAVTDSTTAHSGIGGSVCRPGLMRAVGVVTRGRCFKCHRGRICGKAFFLRTGGECPACLPTCYNLNVKCPLKAHCDDIYIYTYVCLAHIGTIREDVALLE